MIKLQELINDLKYWNKKFYQEVGKGLITRDYYRSHTKMVGAESSYIKLYGSFKKFREVALQLTSTKRQHRNVSKLANTKTKTFVVSCVVEGAPINTNMIKAMETYCEANNAELVLLWSRGVWGSDEFTDEIFKLLEPYLVTEFKFNSKLIAKDFMLHPAQIEPLTGLRRYGQGGASLIVASTKQHMASIPRPRGCTPHVVWTTGTASMPKYSNTRQGQIAAQDNKLGGLIVEVCDEKKFHIRPFQYINDGFVDLGKKYTKDAVVPVKTKCMVWGDIHFTEESTIALTAAIEQAKLLKPEIIFLHDLCSFNSVSHHNKNKQLTKVSLPKEFATLQQEIDYTKAQLHKLVKELPDVKFIVVNSNHDDFPKKWLEDGTFAIDTPNTKLGIKLFEQISNSPIILLEYMCGINNPNVIFLQEDASYKVEGVECGVHGHVGANGAKGNSKSLATSYGDIMSAHTHSPEVYHDVWIVGTLSKLSLGYTKGTSSWIWGNGVIYENGYKQLLMFIDADWRN